MGKGLCFGLIEALIPSVRPLDAQVPNLYRGPAYSPLCGQPFGPCYLDRPSSLIPRLTGAEAMADAAAAVATVR
jgi:hypothetical protein